MSKGLIMKSQNFTKFKNIISRCNRHYLRNIIIILCIAIILPLWWCRPNEVIMYGDAHIPLDPNYALCNSSFTWDSIYFLGEDNSKGIGKAGQNLYYVFFKLVGRTIPNMERLFFIFLLTITGFSMYYLMLQITRGKSTMLLAAIFYMVSSYQYNTWSGLHMTSMMAYAFMPLSLGIYIRALKVEKKLLKYSVLLAFSFLPPVVMVTNPPNAITYVAVVMLYGIFYSLFNSIHHNYTKVKYCLKFSTISLCLIVLIYLWVLLPFGLHTYCFSQSVKAAVGGDTISWLNWKSRCSSFLNLFCLQGHISFYYRSILNPLEKYHTNGFLILSGYLIPIFALLSLITSKKNKFTIFFSSIFVLFLFLAKGAHSPFAWVFIWMYNHLPFFWVYRSIWEKLMAPIFLSIAVLIGISIDNIRRLIKKDL